MRYWISWIQKTEDYRPITYPPNEAVLGWWCSGTDGDGNASICAVVKADDDVAASVAIFKDWPEASSEVAEHGWRFFQKDVGNNWTPNDRFPVEGWMVPRFDENVLT